MEREARIEAQKQWNNRACGELDQEKGTLEYFLAVEKERYSQQAWTLDYFNYKAFKGKDILEIGIGQGTDLMQFARSGATCHGVDITENHLKLTAENFKLQGYPVDLRKGDATQLPFEDQSMDCVYSFGVLHHIPEIEKVIAEIHRVLKPGGEVFIALYSKWSAFHLVKWLFLKGLIKGDLFRLGYNGLLATIEGGADGLQIKPYVKLYTKSEVRELLKNFKVNDLSIHQLFIEHLLPESLVRRWRRRELPLAGQFGWYVAAKAQKSGV